MMFLIMIPFNFNYINATTYEQARYEVKNIEYACACLLALPLLFCVRCKTKEERERGEIFARKLQTSIGGRQDVTTRIFAMNHIF